ncbi:MAG: helicase-related protein [archaeon]
MPLNNKLEPNENEKFIVHPYITKNKVEKRLYQELLTAEAITQSTLVVAPTGLGKTIVAVLLIAFTYDSSKSILLLAPTKPLISQHKKSLDKLLTIEQENMILLTGEITPAKREQIYLQKGLIICATPQTIANDIDNGLLREKDFNLIIFDEAHRAVGDYSYTKVSNFFPENTKRLGLTASPGGEKKKIREVADNLKISHVEIRTENDIDVKDYINETEIEIIFTELDSFSRKLVVLIDEFIEQKISVLRKLNFPIGKNYTKKQIIMLQAQVIARLSKSKNNMNFLALSFTACILKMYHAKELIETQGIIPFKNYIYKLEAEGTEKKRTKALSQVLGSKEFIEIRKVLNSTILENQVYSKEAKLIEISNLFLEENKSSKILVFTNFRDNASHLVTVLNRNKKIKATKFVGQANKENDAGLSQKEQMETISKFKEGEYNILVCTSVGEEGLDIPSVDLVVFYDAVASEIRSIQRRGRTGRFNVGKVVLILNKDTLDEHYYYVSENKEKKMKRTLKNFNLNEPIKKKKTQKSLIDFK